MTRTRFFGSDAPFCAWLREQKRELPSKDYESVIGISVTDCDLILHRFKTEVDSEGTREIQAIMMLEVKTRNADPTFAQIDTLKVFHNTIRRKPWEDQATGQVLFNFGVSFLKLSDLTPADSKTMHWGRLIVNKRFKQVDGQIQWKPINLDTLHKLMRFDVHPTTFAWRPFRRHHKTKELEQLVQYPLGFVARTKIKFRS